MRRSVLLSTIVFNIAAITTAMTSTPNEISNPPPISNVVIAIAMEAEASPFINHLSLENDATFFPANSPFQAFRGKYETCEVTVITNGKDDVYGTGVDNVGTVPAALASYLALAKLDGQADLLINAGTCGGFKSNGAGIGDVFLTTGIANHDRRIPIPGFDSYGIGKIESTDVRQLADDLDMKTGVCTTGNSLDMHDVDELHMKKNDASVKDMEAAAIAWSCQLHKTPFLGVKVVTDIVDGDKPTQEEFMSNLHAASQSLQVSLPKVLAHVCGRKHDEL